MKRSDMLAHVGSMQQAAYVVRSNTRKVVRTA